MAELKIAGSVPAEATPQSRPDLFGTRGQLRPDGDGGILSAMMNDKPEYATPDVSQVSSGFYVEERGLPWHVTLARQLGTPDLMAGAKELLRSQEAIELGGFDFNVDLLPITPLGSDALVPGKWATVRGDTGAALGIVGRSYKVVQPRDSFTWIDQLVDDGQAKFETAGVMRGGAWTFVSAELDHLDIDVPGDPSALRTYLSVWNSFDGSLPLSAHVHHVRVVCKNTSEIAKAGAVSTFRIRHSGSIEGKLATAREALGIAFRNTELVKQITSQLAGIKLVDRQVRELLEKKIFPLPDDISEERAEKHHSRLAFENYLSSPTLEGIRGTGWGAFNAVTEYLDHEVNYRSRQRQSPEELRADSLLFGQGKDTKNRALSVLLKLGK